ncbi:sterol desaturase family protein [Pseudoalteromonas sp. JBTF-M23]|uniref:Sterol desaturase family protein n=1 Tax=Pseudoalteromonas caenipelagi TaxID=2726988 RepID=A0A849VGM2_9GAMM|nr:sterol desaturase family protein [Pseudoalteromonas caenipelagi]NOU52405.1 sterol desaturase family protein [Pseudoalteromonas caenipelagi]
MNVEFILLALSPLFGLAIIVEYRNAKSGYTLKEFLLNLGLALSHQASDLIALFVLMPFFYWLHMHFAVVHFELNPLNITLAFILQDFLYYWFHRVSHRCNWLWCAHIVHHSSVNMNFSTAMRQSLFYPIVGMWLFWLPLIIIGYPPELVFAIVAVNLAYQFFVHTEQAPNLKWFGVLFNTPTHHCLHHARNPEYIDKNYAGVLIVWDKLFGTFVEPIASKPPQYGVAERHYRVSFYDVLVTPWLILLHNLRLQNSWRGKLRLLFGKPHDLKQH